jgi:hypothetical protein
MKLNHLFESTFDEQAAWDYLYLDPLLEMHRNEFKRFLRSKAGQDAKVNRKKIMARR